MSCCAACATTPVSDGYVLDSSVAVRWYLDQPGFQHARQVRDMGVRLLAPAVLRWELGNVLRLKGVVQGLLTPDEVLQALQDLPLLGVRVREDDEASTLAAARLSLTRSVSLFDAAFVFLALRTGLPLLTADARLARSVAGLISTELLRGAVPGPTRP
jgi:predicted nucleic acid-binding protein